jgi:predicted dehydrogenase
VEDLKIGIIGSGGRGGVARHAHNVGNGSRIVACCDLSPTTLEQNRERYGSDIFTTSDYRELLSQDVDAVFVTTPDFLHEEMAIAALEAGKAVYLEKPMAITTEGCDRILETAKAHGSRLYVGHNMRHMGFVRTMKDLIDAGAIGNVKTAWVRHFVGNGGDYYFKDWHAERKYSTGLLLQKSAHDIDIIHWLTGGYSELVQAMGALTVYGDITDRAKFDGKPRPAAHFKGEEMKTWPPGAQKDLNSIVDVEDVSLVNMRLNNGVMAAYQQCHYTPDYWRSYTIIGDEGRIENFGNGGEGTCVKVWNKRRGGFIAPDAVHMIDQVAGGHGGADPRIVEEFVRFARDGGKTTTSPVAARYSVATGCAATYSLRNGNIPVEVAPVAAETAAYFEN